MKNRAPYVLMAVGLAFLLFSSLAGAFALEKQVSKHRQHSESTNSDVKSIAAPTALLQETLSVSKTATPSTATPGALVTFTVEISNGYPVELKQVKVEDSLSSCRLIPPPAPKIPPATSQLYSCTVTAGNTDITNYITVTAVHPTIGALEATDNASVDILLPSLAVTKTADVPTATVGALINYTIDVSNDGEVDLIELAVVDDQCALSGPSDSIITAGTTFSYNCSVTAGDADITNVVNVTATSPSGVPITGTSTAFVDVLRPSLAVTKTALPAVARNGDTISYSIDVTNDGDYLLSSLNVVDSLCTLAGPTATVITPSVAYNYSCSVTAGALDISNTVTVTANDPFGAVIVRSASAFVDVVAPSIVITKSPASQFVLNGATAQFTVTIENNGDGDLFDISVSDLQASGCNATVSQLAPGVKLQSSCSVADVTADFSNEAIVTAVDPAGDPLLASSTADVTVINPSIAVAKIPQSQYVYSQGTAFFTITITNTGDVQLENVIVRDPKASNCDRNIGILEPNSGTFSYACFQPNVTSNFTNTATVTGTHLLGDTVSDDDMASVTIIAPTIAIDKTPDIQTIGSGGTASFTIYVTNTGNITLTNVLVTDPASPDCAFGPVTLPAQMGIQYSCSHSGETEDFLNTAFVVGEDPLAGTVQDSDIGFVNVVQANIVINKTASSATVISGEPVDFLIQVENPSNSVDLKNVAVTDALAPDCNRVIGDLPRMGQVAYSCSLSNVTTAFTNLASVNGNSASDNQLVTDSDIATVEVLELDVVLTAVTSSLPEPGGMAGFDLLVINRGSKRLTVTDMNSALGGDITILPGSNCNNGVAIAANGGVYDCSFELEVTGQPGVIDVNVTVTAEDDAGLPIEDSGGSGITITDVPSAIATSLMADPTSLAEPGGDVLFNLRIDNNSPQDEVTIESLDGGALLGNLDGQGDCSLGITIPVNESYQCLFSVAISGDPGTNLDFEATASGIDDDNQAVSGSDQETVTIFNLPSSMAVTVTAVPGSVPEPGRNVAFTVRVENLSQVDDMTINSLNGGSLGDLNGQGTCDLATATLQAGGVYQCAFTASVIGQQGESKSFTVTVSAVDDDGDSLVEADQVTINFLAQEISYVYLPLTTRPNCFQARLVQLNQDYFFRPDARDAWYVFSLPVSANVVVELTDFTPVDGQVVVYRGMQDCSVQFLKNNGDFSTTKIVVLGTQPAGLYYVRVLNDGPLLTQPYRLRIRTQ